MSWDRENFGKGLAAAMVIAVIAGVAFVALQIKSCAVQMPVECAKACGERGVHHVGNVCECK